MKNTKRKKKMKAKAIQEKIQDKKPFVYQTVVAKHIDVHGLTVYHIRTRERRISTYDHHGRIIWLNNKPVPTDWNDKQPIRKTTRQVIHTEFPSCLKPAQGVIEIHYQEQHMVLNDLTKNNPATRLQYIKPSQGGNQG